MTKLFLVLAALMIASSPVHAQVRINGGADVGASFIISTDSETSEQVGENLFKITPKLLNYPVTKWCVSKREGIFKTINKELACTKATWAPWNWKARSCRVATVTLEMNRAIPIPTEDGKIVWVAAPESFEILTVEGIKPGESVDSGKIIRRDGYTIKECN